MIDTNHSKTSKTNTINDTKEASGNVPFPLPPSHGSVSSEGEHIMHRFYTDETGLSAIETGVITSTLGLCIAVFAYYFGEMFSSLFYTLGDCINMGFEPECYSIHNNHFDTPDLQGEPVWWPHS